MPARSREGLGMVNFSKDVKGFWMATKRREKPQKKGES